MQRTCLDIASISRYLNSLAEIEDVLRIERHVERCARCRDKLIRMKRHSEALFEDLASPGANDVLGCPSHIQLQHFSRGNLSERQMVRVQEHLLACAHCRSHLRPQPMRPSGAQGEPSERNLFATRRPDLDLRVAPQGIRIAVGAELLDDSMVPALLRRLDLSELAPQAPELTTARQLCFVRHAGPNVLRGRVELAGYEDFHVELQACNDPSVEALQLWTREGSIRRFAANRRFRELLEPGHYFIGPSLFESPWLALCVEQDFLTARGLVECAYDACRRGHFHAALRWLEDAVQLAPDVDAYRVLLRGVGDFARRFGLDDRERSVRWQEGPRPRNEAETDPADLDEPPTSSAAIARLVIALRRRVEAGDERHVFAEARYVSRQVFRTALVELLRLFDTQLEPFFGPGRAAGASS